MFKFSRIMDFVKYAFLVFIVIGASYAFSISLIQVNTTSSQTMTNKTMTSPVIDGTGIVLEGATANDFETTIAAEDPTADRTHTVPDVTSDTFALLAATQTFTGKTLTSATLTGTPTISGVIQGASPLIFEGATANDFETTFAITDPTADRIFTFPDVASDTVVTLAAAQILSTKTITNTTDINITSTEGSNFTASDACASGFNRVGLWCMHTTGAFAALRTSVTAEESAYTTTVVNASAKLVILRVVINGLQDGTGEDSSVWSCVVPGDSGVSSCAVGDSSVVSRVRIALANGRAMSFNTATYQSNSSGEVKTFCNIDAALTSGSCDWFIEGYMD